METNKMKKCFRCGEVKRLESFYRHPQMKDGRVNKCKECNKEDVRLNYKKNKKHYQGYEYKRHRLNFDRLFSNRYQLIVNRCESDSRYSKRTYLDKEEFIDWCQDNMESFIEVWKDWKKSGFQRKYSPSIDRIDNEKGYYPDNMQWLSLVNNVKKYHKKDYVFPKTKN